MEKAVSSENIADNGRLKYYLTHGGQYVVVITIFLAGLIIITLVKNQSMRLFLDGALSLFYFSFGIFHHWEEKNLRLLHFFEYGIVSFLIFLVLYWIYL